MNIQYWSEKYVKKDRDGKLIEPLSYQELKPISGKRLENYKNKVKERIRNEKKRGY